MALQSMGRSSRDTEGEPRVSSSAQGMHKDTLGAYAIRLGEGLGEQEQRCPPQPGGVECSQSVDVKLRGEGVVAQTISREVRCERLGTVAILHGKVGAQLQEDQVREPVVRGCQVSKSAPELAEGLLHLDDMPTGVRDWREGHRRERTLDERVGLVMGEKVSQASGMGDEGLVHAGGQVQGRTRGGKRRLDGKILSRKPRLCVRQLGQHELDMLAARETSAVIEIIPVEVGAEANGVGTGAGWRRGAPADSSPGRGV